MSPTRDELLSTEPADPAEEFECSACGSVGRDVMRRCGVCGVGMDEDEREVSGHE